MEDKNFSNKVAMSADELRDTVLLVSTIIKTQVLNSPVLAQTKYAKTQKNLDSVAGGLQAISAEIALCQGNATLND